MMPNASAIDGKSFPLAASTKPAMKTNFDMHRVCAERHLRVQGERLMPYKSVLSTDSLGLSTSSLTCSLGKHERPKFGRCARHIWSFPAYEVKVPVKAHSLDLHDAQGGLIA